MNLGIFLSPGESLKLMKKTGQDVRFVKLYLAPYAKNFSKVYLFSHENEKYNLPKNVILVSNKTSLPRLVYAILLPLVNRKEIASCDVMRGFGLASSLSSLLLSKPFVFNWAYEYINFVKNEGKYFYIPLYFILEKIAFLKASCVFIATKAKMEKLKNSKYIYLPNGVDLKLFGPSATNGKGLAFIGRLEHQKNLFFLLRAISLLPHNIREITFIGQGSLKEELSSYALQNGVKLKIISSVPNNQLPDILKKFSIFLLSSRQEGSPKALLEAMSLGLVPVVTNFPTAREVIENSQNGFITDFVEKDFAGRIKSLMSDKRNYQRMRQNAISKIKNHFDIEAQVKKEISVLKNV